jgi:FkbM family methyltransferase
LRSAIGTNGVAAQIATLEAKIDLLIQRLPISAAASTSTVATSDQFVPVTLPNGATYQLSIAAENRDAYHNSVATEAAYDSNWHFLNAWVRPGDIFFDLGANIGTITIPAAVNGATVHAFELLDANVRHIARSVQRNALSSIFITVCAISDKDGLAGLGGISAWGTVVPNALISIPTVVIDNYVQRRAVSVVDLMKIDVEGSEKGALYGASKLIERDHPDIVIECNAATCGNNGYSYRDLLSFLEARGYSLYRLHERRLCPWTAAHVQEVIYADYLATTKSAAEITGRSGWAIANLTEPEIIESIIGQELYGDLHRDYLLAIEASLAPAIRSDERVSTILRRSEAARNNEAIIILKIGSK